MHITYIHIIYCILIVSNLYIMQHNPAYDILVGPVNFMRLASVAPGFSMAAVKPSNSWPILSKMLMVKS